MTDWQLKTWLHAQSLIAQMEAAKIENKVREMRGEYPNYGEDWFNGIANRFEELTHNL